LIFRSQSIKLLINPATALLRLKKLILPAELRRLLSYLSGIIWVFSRKKIEFDLGLMIRLKFSGQQDSIRFTAIIAWQTDQLGTDG
jgi:hypothetical protein